MRQSFRSPLAFATGLLALTAIALSVSAHADTFVLKDGRTLDGKVLREKDGFIYLRTLGGTEKVALDAIESKTEGESLAEVYARLVKTAEGDPKNAEAQWALFSFLREHESANDDFPKLAKKTLKRVLRSAPDHEEARDANGEVGFEGAWVKKADLPRLKAEAAKRKKLKEWGQRLGVKVDIEETEHFLIVDATEDKDLGGRGAALEEAYTMLTELLGVEELWSEKSPTILLETFGDYEPALDAYQKQWNMPGWWLSAAKSESGGGVWRERPVPTQLRFPTSGKEGMWYACVHNVAHLAVWRLWAGSEAPPTWLEEGLGEFIEGEVMGENVASCVGISTKSKKGATTDRSKRSKKGRGGKSLKDSQNEWKELCIEAVQDGSFPSMRKFLNMKMGDYGPAEEGAALGLVTWLVGRDSEKFAELVKKLRGFSRDPNQPWKDTYGFEKIEDMESEWKVWVLSEW